MTTKDEIAKRLNAAMLDKPTINQCRLIDAIAGELAQLQQALFLVARDRVRAPTQQNDDVKLEDDESREADPLATRAVLRHLKRYAYKLRNARETHELAEELVLITKWRGRPDWWVPEVEGEGDQC